MKIHFTTAILSFGLCVFCSFSSTGAADYVIGTDQTVTIGAGAPVSLTTEKYQNDGTLAIEAGGKLEVGATVTNQVTVEGIEGLDLGLVQSFGTIEADQIIRFHEGSTVWGTVTSSGNVIFDGASTVAANITAQVLVFNALPIDADEDAKSGASKLDLSSGQILDVDLLQLTGPLEVTLGRNTDESARTLTLEGLSIGGTGTSLVIDGNLEVLDNYSGFSGTTIICMPDTSVTDKIVGHGTITLRGGGEAEDGFNNLVAQSHLYAAKVQVENYTYIPNYLQIYGDFILAGGDQNITRGDGGLRIYGKTVVQQGSTLLLAGESTGQMVLFKYNNYNGIFVGGFDLEQGATLKAIDPENHSLQLAVGAKSTLAAGSTMLGRNVVLIGTDADGNITPRTITSRGTVEARKLLTLNSVALENVGEGIIRTNQLKMLGKSVLDLTSNGAADGKGGLIFTGENSTLDIGTNSVLRATGKKLDFTGVAVTNKNTEMGIFADQLYFGSGGSYTGAGKVTTGSATFADGSSFILDSSGHADFGNAAILFQSGSTIGLNIATAGVGAIVTTGQVQTEAGVYLEVVDGSNYSGRTKTFEVIHGGDGSVYGEDLKFAKSLFFELSDAWQDGNSLFVEIVKVADLVDFADSGNQRRLANMIDTLLNQGGGTASQRYLFDALMRIKDDATYREALDDVSGVTRENSVVFALASPWETSMRVGLNRLSLAPLGASVAGDAPGNRVLLGQSRFRMPRFGMPKMPKWTFAHDLWFETFYDYTKLDNDGNAPGGEGHRGGFVAGMGLPTRSRESLLGLSLGYAAGQYKQMSDKVDLGDFRIGLYGGANLFSRNLQLRAYVGYGFQDYKMKRNVLYQLPVSGDSDGDAISAAIVLIRPVDISDRFLLKPSVGFDLERLTQDAFSETGSAGAVLSYSDLTFMRTMFRLGVSGDYALSRADLRFRLMYGLKIAGDKTADADHQFVGTPDSLFGVNSISLGTHVFDVGFGGNIALNQRRTVLMMLDYNANLTENSGIHSASVGFLWKR